MTELAVRTFISDPRFAQERKKHFASGNAALSALQSELVPQEASIRNNKTSAKGLRKEAEAMGLRLAEIDEAIEAEEQNQGKKGKAKPAKGQPPGVNCSAANCQRPMPTANCQLSSAQLQNANCQLPTASAICSTVN